MRVNAGEPLRPQSANPQVTSQIALPKRSDRHSDKEEVRGSSPSTPPVPTRNFLFARVFLHVAAGHRLVHRLEDGLEDGRLLGCLHDRLVVLPGPGRAAGPDSRRGSNKPCVSRSPSGAPPTRPGCRLADRARESLSGANRGWRGWLSEEAVHPCPGGALRLGGLAENPSAAR